MLTLIIPLLWLTLAGAKCYEPAIPHPLPDYDLEHPVLKNAFAGVHDALAIQVAAPEHANTSFSVEVTSSKVSLWSYHHTARVRNSSRPDIPEVNGDALYRIASITKSFTVLGILYQHAAGNLSLDDPITKYIPELTGSQEGTVPWQDITLRSLASQLSGIPREFAQSDLVNSEHLGLLDLGLPPVSKEHLIDCDEYSHNYEKPCSAEDLLGVIKTDDPVFAPNQKSTYSNVAFELLGLALANVTGQTCESYISNAILEPLNMGKSRFSTPPDEAGVIPVQPHYWDVDEGVQNPTGGIYSSSADLSKFLRYILTHYNGITHAVNWLHPVSPASGSNSFYGMPWEIFTTDRILENPKRTVRFVTKSGGLSGYTSVIITVPEYDLGITILVAGPPHFFSTIQETVTVELVRAAEEISISQMYERYTGNFIYPDPAQNSSIALAVDSRGLRIESFISNGTDMFTSGLLKYVAPPDDTPWHVQLVPTMLYRDEEAMKGQIWRAEILEERDESNDRVWDDFCMTTIDLPTYAGLPLNELVFWDEIGNRFDTVELTGFRVNLSRIITRNEEISNEDEEILEL